MRLDGFIAKATGLSRKDAKRAIGQGRVQVAGSPCRQAAHAVAADDTVTLDDRELNAPTARYLMLHKPAGVVSATVGEDRHPSVLSLLPAQWQRDLHPVGRLDQDTTGLLLLTTDGQWSHRITAPRHRCPKTYRVTLAEPLTASALAQLREGLRLRNDPTPTAPAEAEAVDTHCLDLTLREGRYHQVKRMLAAVGNRVVALHRTRIGDLVLDPELAPGEFRALTDSEIDGFLKGGDSEPA